jgi:hypothetical protein
MWKNKKGKSIHDFPFSQFLPGVVMTDPQRAAVGIGDVRFILTSN